MHAVSNESSTPDGVGSPDDERARPSTQHAAWPPITVRSVEVSTMKLYSGRAFALMFALMSGLAVACSDDDPTGTDDSQLAGLAQRDGRDSPAMTKKRLLSPTKYRSEPALTSTASGFRHVLPDALSCAPHPASLHFASK